MKYTTPIKIYLFKDKNKVDISIKVTDELVNGYRFKIDEFEKILNYWKTGVEFDFDGGYLYVEYKKHGPRPEKVPSPYVRFSISCHGLTFHHRLSYNDMLQLEKDYFFQKSNVMYWDQNV
jgi:hypothetical protein